MPPRAFTDEQAKEFGELYKSGFTQVQLAEHFHLSWSTVHDWLHRLGLETRSNATLNEQQIDEAARLYASGKSTLVIAKMFHVVPQTVANFLQKRGVTLRPAGGRRRLSLREDAFDTRDDVVDYWLGIMATDGNVTGTGGVIDEVKLALKMSDSDHLYAFRSFLGSGHAVGLSVDGHPTDSTREVGMARFAVRSRKLVAGLAQYGIVPRKTIGLTIVGGVETSRNFWRGAIDGDGHLGVHASNQGPDAILKIGGASESFLRQFRDFMRANGFLETTEVRPDSLEGSLAVHQKYVYKLAGRAALDAAALLYVGGSPVLPRKQLAAADMILRGSRRELVGTIRESWSNPRAVEWANMIKSKAA